MLIEIPLPRDRRLEPSSTSWTTSGSAFSLIVTAAVVCGTYTVTTPSLAPDSAIASCTREVMSIISFRRCVLIS